MTQKEIRNRIKKYETKIKYWEYQLNHGWHTYAKRTQYKANIELYTKLLNSLKVLDNNTV